MCTLETASSLGGSTPVGTWHDQSTQLGQRTCPSSRRHAHAATDRVNDVPSGPEHTHQQREERAPFAHIELQFPRPISCPPPNQGPPQPSSVNSPEKEGRALEEAGEGREPRDPHTGQGP